jgi:hypothetical protein
MKTALFLLGLIPSLALAQVSDPAPAIVEGQVVSATTGQPLRKAKMNLAQIVLRLVAECSRVQVQPQTRAGGSERAGQSAGEPDHPRAGE